MDFPYLWREIVVGPCRDQERHAGGPERAIALHSRHAAVPAGDRCAQGAQPAGHAAEAPPDHSNLGTRVEPERRR
jgi:hypothetical protein